MIAIRAPNVFDDNGTIVSAPGPCSENIKTPVWESIHNHCYNTSTLGHQLERGARGARCRSVCLTPYKL